MAKNKNPKRPTTERAAYWGEPLSSNAAAKDVEHLARADSPTDETRDPETPQQWQEAVDQADFHLLVHRCRSYGMIEGGPNVNIERCEEILKQGRNLGYRPARKS